MTPSTVLIALLLPVFQEPAAEVSSAPARTVLPEEPVVLEADFSLGWPMIQVRINGTGPHAMILDTGAGGTTVDGDLSFELDLPVNGQTLMGDPSDVAANTVDLVGIEALDLGAAHFEGLEAVVWDQPAMLGRGVRGIVGWPVFEDCLLTIDRAGKQVRIESGELPEPDGSQVVSFVRDEFGAITLPIDVAGVTVEAHLDSGNARSVSLPRSLRERVPIVAGTEQKGRGMRASGPVEFTTARLDGSIRIGGITMESPEVRFDEKMKTANLGATFLDQCVLTIDLKNRRMRMTPRTAAAPAEARAPARRAEDRSGRRRLGAAMTPDGDGRLQVVMVEASSLAEQVGLAAGDVLLSVDGAAVTMKEAGPLSEALSGSEAFTLEVRRGEETVELKVPAPS